jgi:uridine phosphorylase
MSHSPNPPILEFDPDRDAIIAPYPPNVDRPVPERAVLTFFTEVLAALLEAGRLEPFAILRTELGAHPLYIYCPEVGGEEILVGHAGLGAPLSVGLTEEIIALGARKLIACGSCGVLRPEIAAGHPVVLTAAVRDEGTSYHYLPPSREAYPHPRAVAALEEACRAVGIDYRLGKAWTTDAFYRETPARRAARLAEGCDVVEMEASAFFALAQFRGVIFGQIVYGGDLVVPEGWDHRSWHDRHDDRRLLFDLAVDACLRI